MIGRIVIFSLIIIFGVIVVGLFNLISEFESEIGWTQPKKEIGNAEDDKI